jgi:hypothetical protein
VCSYTRIHTRYVHIINHHLLAPVSSSKKCPGQYTRRRLVTVGSLISLPERHQRLGVLFALGDSGPESSQRTKFECNVSYMMLAFDTTLHARRQILFYKCWRMTVQESRRCGPMTNIRVCLSRRKKLIKVQCIHSIVFYG